MYDTLNHTLFFLFPEGMCCHDRQQEFFLSLSLSSLFVVFPVATWSHSGHCVGEWCTSCGVGMTVLSNLLHLVCTALRSLDNSPSCWLNLRMPGRGRHSPSTWKPDLSERDSTRLVWEREIWYNFDICVWQTQQYERPPAKISRAWHCFFFWKNDAVMSVYPNIFWTPYDDESPQDKATREEEEKEKAKLEGWGGVVRRISGGWDPCLPHGDIHLLWNTIIINCGSKTLVTCHSCDFICMRFYILIFWLKSITRNTVYVYKYFFSHQKTISVEDWGFSVQFWTPPFPVFPPTVLPLSLWLCERLE